MAEEEVVGELEFEEEEEELTQEELNKIRELEEMETHKRKVEEVEEKKTKRHKPECSICRELPLDAVVGNCGHSFCQMCILQWETDDEKGCPTCKKRNETEEWAPNFMLREMLEDPQFDEDRQDRKRKLIPIETQIKMEETKLRKKYSEFEIVTNQFPPNEKLLLLKFIREVASMSQTRQNEFWNIHAVPEPPSFIMSQNDEGGSVMSFHLRSANATFVLHARTEYNHFLFISSLHHLVKQQSTE
jgi:hypothetical protein